MKLTRPSLTAGKIGVIPLPAMKSVLLIVLMSLELAGWLGFAAGAPNPPALDFEPNLPIVFLDTTNQIVAEPKVACVIKVLSPKGARRAETAPLPAAVRIHGASSQGYPKKSYSFSLNTAAQLLDLRTNAHWILQAAYVDRSLMRHKLSYDLFRSLSTRDNKRFASASRFVEVFVNDKYNGAYLLMERVDQQLLEFRPFRSNDVSHACIYKAVDHAANFGHPGRGGYEQREPEETVRPYWQPLEEFNRFVSTTPNEVFFHPQTGVGARLDLDNAIDFHLLVLVTSNSDGITKNFFFARDGREAGPLTARFQFAPWDYDGTFGRNWDGSPYPATVWLSNHLFDRLVGNAAYRKKFVARWRQLKDQEFSARTIQAMMDANARALGDAVQRNAARWPRGGYSFAQDLTQMKAWIETRIQWLDQQISRMKTE